MRRLTHSRLNVALSAAIVGVAALMVIVNTFSASATRNEESGAAKSPAELTAKNTLAVAPQGESTVVERVTLFPYGFEPDEITRPSGAFLLAIDNRAGTGDLQLELATETRQLVHRDSIRRGRAQMQKTLSLAPGKYVLVEANNPKWTCTLTITP